MEHLVSVQKTKKNREEEMKFLKMIPDNKNKLIEEFSKENRNIRKIDQEQKNIEYDKVKKDLEEKILLIEGYDIKEAMKNERREWINKEKSDNKGEPPHSLDQFYKRLDVEKRVELDENQKKVAENIAKEKLKKEQDKKKKDETGALIKRKILKI